MILFHHKSKTLQPRFAPWLYVAMVMIFVTVTQFQVIIGLTGLGVTLLIGGVILELNSPKVWADSMQWRKKNKNMAWYQRPNKLLYQVHIWLLWPLVIFLGLSALISAYSLAA